MNWSQQEFLDRIENPELHQALLDGIERTPEVRAEFMPKNSDSKLAGYKVYIGDVHVLWIMEPSKKTKFYPTDVYIAWGLLPTELATFWRDLWQCHLTTSDHQGGAFAKEGLEGVGVECVLANLGKLVTQMETR